MRVQAPPIARLATISGAGAYVRRRWRAIVRIEGRWQRQNQNRGNGRREPIAARESHGPLTFERGLRRGEMSAEDQVGRNRSGFYLTSARPKGGVRA